MQRSVSHWGYCACVRQTVWLESVKEEKEAAQNDNIRTYIVL